MEELKYPQIEPPSFCRKWCHLNPLRGWEKPWALCVSSVSLHLSYIIEHIEKKKRGGVDGEAEDEESKNCPLQSPWPFFPTSFFLFSSLDFQIDKPSTEASDFRALPYLTLYSVIYTRRFSLCTHCECVKRKEKWVSRKIRRSQRPLVFSTDKGWMTWMPMHVSCNY